MQPPPPPSNILSLTVFLISFIAIKRLRTLWNGNVGKFFPDGAWTQADITWMNSVEDEVHHPAEKETSPSQGEHVMDHGDWEVVIYSVYIQQHHLLLQIHQR